MTAPRPRRVIVDMDPEEISAVDEPAQEPANIRARKNRTGEPTMADKTPAQYEAEIAELIKSVKRLTALAEMTDDEKAHMRALEPDDRPAFVGKSATERQAAVKAARDADPVVYEAKTGKSRGRKFRKSEQALAEMAEELDEKAASNALVVEVGRKARVEARVKELKHLSDDKGGLAVVVLAIDSLPDGDEKTKAFKSLDAANAAAARGQRADGDDSLEVSESSVAAKAKFMDRVTKFAAQKGISAEEAMHRAPLEDREAKRLMGEWRAAEKAS